MVSAPHLQICKNIRKHSGGASLMISDFNRMKQKTRGSLRARGMLIASASSDELSTSRLPKAKKTNQELSA